MKMSIPPKHPGRIFAEINKLVLKCKWNGRGTRLGRKILKKKSDVAGLTVLDYKTAVIKTV